MKKFACCFSGHRDINADEISIISKRIEEYMENLIKEHNVLEFICGGALGFDTLAAQLVLQMKRKYPNITLFLALPCINQSDLWSKENKNIYKSIKSCADKIEYTSKAYYSGCMLKRNRFMIENSSFCICYLNKKKGGTYYTVNLAKKSGVLVLNCF